jgi:hypothetical protein
MKLLLTMVLISLQLVSFELKADPPPANPPAKKTDNVMDFEGDVIQGEKKRPDLFLDLKMSDVQTDDFLYQRADFNDFFKFDKKFRTKFIK